MNGDSPIDKRPTRPSLPQPGGRPLQETASKPFYKQPHDRADASTSLPASLNGMASIHRFSTKSYGPTDRRDALSGIRRSLLQVPPGASLPSRPGARRDTLPTCSVDASTLQLLGVYEELLEQSLVLCDAVTHHQRLSENIGVHFLLMLQRIAESVADHKACRQPNAMVLRVVQPTRE